MRRPIMLLLQVRLMTDEELLDMIHTLECAVPLFEMHLRKNTIYRNRQYLASDNPPPPLDASKPIDLDIIKDQLWLDHYHKLIKDAECRGLI